MLGVRVAGDSLDLAFLSAQRDSNEASLSARFEMVGVQTLTVQMKPPPTPSGDQQGYAVLIQKLRPNRGV